MIMSKNSKINLECHMALPLAVEIFFENDDSRKNNIIGKCIKLVLFKEGIFYLFLATGFFYFCPILAHAG